ncbi:hypothetical protein FVE85_2661 [Porphyridium purpureum]|uniref:CCHC-type domain-containing protein n=1 Tax=Porphyridium purpureum TaxID=35688 RepID=A0A5J4YU05_PORPP|nr:hypothetical protein FVE85_2661 [Porphyridium purpureum]|eukprot:POR2737..scf227_4
MSQGDMEALVAGLRTELGTDLRNASERIMILEQELARERAAREHMGPPHFSASAVSRVAGPAPMKVFTGARDATEIATWVMDVKERIYEPLQEEAAASGRTWAASSERLAVRTAATYLEGDAKAWYVHLAQKPETFSDFLGELTARFRPMDFAKRARDQLAETRQGDKSVEDYVVAFDSLCLKIPDIGSAEKLDRFVRGLNERVRIEVLLRQPSTYEDGLTKALDVDSVLKTGQRRIGGPSFGSGSDGRAPMELGAAEQMQKKKKMKFKKKRRGRKSRQNDVCHACKKKGHWQRDCPDAETDGVELELLHAERGMAGEKALSLVKRNVSVDGVAAVAVVDTGATNTFLSYSLCLREGIKVVKRATLAVRLANGSVTRARGIARVVIGMAGFRNARLTAIVRSGKHDVILGLDWLRAQGASLRVGGQEFLQTEVVCLNKIDHEVRTRSGAARRPSNDALPQGIREPSPLNPPLARSRCTPAVPPPYPRCTPAVPPLYPRSLNSALLSLSLEPSRRFQPPPGCTPIPYWVVIARLVPKGRGLQAYHAPPCTPTVQWVRRDQVSGHGLWLFLIISLTHGLLP